MRFIGVILLLAVAGCGEEPELFCQGVVKNVSDKSGNFTIEFCDGSTCLLPKHQVRQRGVPSGRIAVWFDPFDKEFDLKHEDPVPGCSTSGTRETTLRGGI